MFRQLTRIERLGLGVTKTAALGPGEQVKTAAIALIAGVLQFLTSAIVDETLFLQYMVINLRWDWRSVNRLGWRPKPYEQVKEELSQAIQEYDHAMWDFVSDEGYL